MLLPEREQQVRRGVREYRRDGDVRPHARRPRQSVAADRGDDEKDSGAEHEPGEG